MQSLVTPKAFLFILTHSLATTSEQQLLSKSLGLHPFVFCDHLCQTVSCDSIYAVVSDNEYLQCTSDNGSVETTITDCTSTMSCIHRMVYSSGGRLKCLQLYQSRGHLSEVTACIPSRSAWIESCYGYQSIVWRYFHTQLLWSAPGESPGSYGLCCSFAPTN